MATPRNRIDIERYAEILGISPDKAKQQLLTKRHIQRLNRLSLAAYIHNEKYEDPFSKGYKREIYALHFLRNLFNTGWNAKITVNHALWQDWQFDLELYLDSKLSAIIDVKTVNKRFPPTISNRQHLLLKDHYITLLFLMIPNQTKPYFDEPLNAETIHRHNTTEWNQQLNDAIDNTYVPSHLATYNAFDKYYNLHKHIYIQWKSLHRHIKKLRKPLFLKQRTIVATIPHVLDNLSIMDYYYYTENGNLITRPDKANRLQTTTPEWRQQPQLFGRFKRNYNDPDLNQ